MGAPENAEGDRVLRFPTAPLSIGLGIGLAISLSLASIVAFPSGPAESREPDKTLRLSFGHTGEKGEFTFKRNGVYDKSELARLNHFLRDWRREEDAHMDPHLLDLVWSIYQQTGSHDYIHVVSAYRSPATNEMLRRRSRGVAKNSQHRLGKAMDWFLTDVPLAKLRATAMKMQGGGVGYYPTSGSPFVHTDTGNVRAWPRMSRQQLIALFPNGNTLHLPADGKPLPGYEQAVARRASAGGTALAYLDTGADDSDDSTDRTGTDTSSNGWLSRVFKGSPQNNAVATASPAPATVQPDVQSAALDTGDVPRPPKARPASAVESPVADASAETVVASVDVAAPAEPPLPRRRPAADAGMAAVDAQDAIATLTERMNQESASADAARPVALAFAAASDAPEPSEADRAILTAFAALSGTDAIHDADAALTAELTRRASAANPQPEQQTQTIAVAYAGSDLLPAPAFDSGAGSSAGPSAGIVLAPAHYDGDEQQLVSLIDPPKHPAPVTSPPSGQMAMPAPASGLFVAPGGASDVADLRGRSGPPVEQFARNGAKQGEAGFLSRLFASLVE